MVGTKVPDSECVAAAGRRLVGVAECVAAAERRLAGLACAWLLTITKIAALV